MNPVVMNWVWFSASFAAFALVLVDWSRWHRGGDRRDPDPQSPRTCDGSPGARPNGQPDAPPRAVDPVSGERLDTDTALPWFHRGKVYLFASEATRSCFAARNGSSPRSGKTASLVIQTAPDARRTRTPSIEKRA